MSVAMRRAANLMFAAIAASIATRVGAFVHLQGAAPPLWNTRFSTERPQWGYKSVEVASESVGTTAQAAAAAAAAAAKLSGGAPTLALLRLGVSASPSPEVLAAAVAAAVTAAVPSLSVVLGFTVEDLDAPPPHVTATVADLKGARLQAFHMEANDVPVASDTVAWTRALGESGQVPTFLLFPSDAFMRSSLLDTADGLDRAFPGNAKRGAVVSAGQGQPAAFVSVSEGGVTTVTLQKTGLTALMLDKDVSADIEALWGWESRLLTLLKWANTMGH